MIRLGQITKLEDANFYLNEMYSLQSCLIELNDTNKTKYKFVNVPTMKRFPYPFKSVKAAMNCLIAHQCGWVGKHKNKSNNDS